VEGAFGTVGLVAGAFDGQLRGPHRTLAAVGDLVCSRQGQGELVGRHRGQQRAGDRLVDGIGTHRAAPWRGDVIGAGV
jgi:hypothetical protein